jgi:hypothetical protein
MSSSWNFPARAELKRFRAEPSRAEPSRAELGPENQILARFRLVFGQFSISSWSEKGHKLSRAKLKILQLELWLEPARLGLITTKYVNKCCSSGPASNMASKISILFWTERTGGIRLIPAHTIILASHTYVNTYLCYQETTDSQPKVRARLSSMFPVGRMTRFFGYLCPVQCVTGP